MVLLDYSQIFIANAMAHLSNSKEKININDDLVRHMILNSIRAYKQKFANKYGEIIIACDSNHSWRKDFFPYYKANRKDIKEKSTIDWDALLTHLNTVALELKKFFPYRVIMVDGAEGDDIIASIIMFTSTPNNKCLIVSGDKDFRQLQQFSGVEQFHPIEKKFIVEKDPYDYMTEHVIIGDRGDGIPNILSDDDVFINKEKRQKTMTAKRLQEFKSMSFTERMTIPNYIRNNTLINLTMVQDLKIYDDISKALISQAGKDRKKLFDYFIKLNLPELQQRINEF